MLLELVFLKKRDSPQKIPANVLVYPPVEGRKW